MRDGLECVIVPEVNAAESSLVTGIQVRAARHLHELRDTLLGEAPWPDWPPLPPTPPVEPEDDVDLAEVRGLPWARRALEAAAAGGHHLLLSGPPGAGKTMLARRLPTILPPLESDEALEVTRIHSAAGHAPVGGLARSRPFRAPHHTASIPALVGGGSKRPHPGEVTLAHRGTLFLDELGEFLPGALDALRQPLEERVVRISRQLMTLSLPADFQLVACTNPCPCGLGPPWCACSEVQRARYRRRLSAPLLDRFDLRLGVRPPEAAATSGEPSTVVRDRVGAARARQRSRYRGRWWNAHVPAGALSACIPLIGDALDAWHCETETRDLTGRGAARIRRVARTLADLDDVETVSAAHISLAAMLREDVP